MAASGEPKAKTADADDGPIVVWLRDDLRLDDNPALALAAETDRPIIPLVVLDEESEGVRALGGAHKWWLHHSLETFARSLRGKGSELTLRRGKAKDHVLDVVETTGATALFFNRRYDQASRAVDDAVVEALGADDHLAPLVTKAPGQRIPRTVDEHELAVRVVLGQQVSTAAARTHAARLVSAYGDSVSDSAGGLTHLFPSVAQLSDIDRRHLAFPASRQRTLTGLIAALSTAEVVLDSGCDWQAARQQLLALPGIGPWTSEMIAMRGLGDPDAFPATDLGVAAAAGHIGLPSAPKPLSEHARAWRPWRSYATQHLWTALDHAVNQWPPKEK